MKKGQMPPPGTVLGGIGAPAGHNGLFVDEKIDMLIERRHSACCFFFDVDVVCSVDARQDGDLGNEVKSGSSDTLM